MELSPYFSIPLVAVRVHVVRPSPAVAVPARTEDRLSIAVPPLRTATGVPIRIGYEFSVLWPMLPPPSRNYLAAYV
jgi:hypothetical protein